MLAFFQQHLSSILQPFADHVDDLHRAVGQLAERQAEAESRADGAHSVLEQHTSQVGDLQDEQRRAAESRARLQKAVDRGDAARMHLEQDVERMKAQFGVSDEDRRSLVANLAEVREDLGESRCKVDQLQSATLALQTKLAENFDEAAIDQLRKSIYSLDQAHESTCARLQAAKREGEDTSRTLEAFRRSYEQDRQKDAQHSDEVGRSLSELGAHLKETNRRSQTNADHLKTTSKIVAPMKARLDRLDGTAQALQAQGEEAARQRADISTQVQGAVKDLDALTLRCGKMDEHVKKISDIQEGMSRITERVNKAHSSLAIVNRLVESQAEQAQKAETRSIALEGGHLKLRERTQRLEEKVSEFESAYGDLRGQRSAMEGTIGRRLQDIDARMQKSAVEHSDTAARVKALEGDMSATRQQVQKQGAGVDLAHEYFQGMTSGLRETHRSVAVDNEMLPPKGMHTVLMAHTNGKPLPLLAKTVMSSYNNAGEEHLRRPMSARQRVTVQPVGK